MRLIPRVWALGLSNVLSVWPDSSLIPDGTWVPNGTNYSPARLAWKVWENGHHVKTLSFESYWWSCKTLNGNRTKDWRLGVGTLNRLVMWFLYNGSTERKIVYRRNGITVVCVFSTVILTLVIWGDTICVIVVIIMCCVLMDKVKEGLLLLPICLANVDIRFGVWF